MRYKLAGLDCAGCAARLEQELRRVKGLEKATINFAARSLDLPPEMLPAAREVIARVEPEVRLIETDGDETREENEKARRNLYRIIIATLLLVPGLIFNERLHRTPYFWAEYAVLLAAYFLVGWPVIRTALRNLARGQFFDETFLMTVATAGAIAIHQLPEAVGVMLFYAVGEYFQERAVNRSRCSIAALLDIRPQYANLKLNGETKRVRPEEVEVGQAIVIKPGERVPLDGEVVDGVSFVDTSALTGEAVPRKVEKGEPILAGMINGHGLLTVRVTRPFEESSVARILELVENAATRKAPTEQFITAFSRYYTPAVVLGALALAVIPPLVLPEAAFSTWIYRALVLLVISCPCALVVSIPLGYFGGIGSASRRGILVKGASFLDALPALHTVVFDKTGTLTRGVFRVSRVVPYNGFTPEELLYTAAAAELYSNHPIAQSIREAWGSEISPDQVKDYHEIPGHGIRAVVKGRQVLAGNDRLLHREGIVHEVCSVEGTGVHVVIDGTFAGYIVIADEVKPDAGEAVARLKELGVKRIVMLTGDEEAVARRVARDLGIDAYFAELLPEDKVAKVEELEASLPDRRRQKLAFVGDGINDAPVITRADVGVAMGGLGSDAAIEAADVVLMEDAPSRLADAIEIARYTGLIVRQNVVLALSIKAFFLILGVLGVATIWEAVFADVGVALAAIFNASRTLRYRPSTL
ncbi:heavy metal translocating P-type ATPase [Neomoorella thermoacetica]|uniref:Zinc-transporting ATPase n=2 Tax=Neomoorella thermoacetica TaxID=1525 RepID=A0AAC9HK05_NEOTH|nr:heavy metal translocating P-type ATPase [Moorella thermoacetica]AKX97673.1 zinc-transporting ATPase [Moorella thermoacetica]AOQ25188.1 Zinc-transporting ATPase [Moorella thermoacetica]OIQ53916.1 zinc-transporting ATPase [Moorella thermoacetica]QDA01495.1 Zinc-transporting ATPase [Moorella thermoacetica]TYL06623.1 Zinc-transporting ATPase [Moorella thermoacetica]